MCAGTGGPVRTAGIDARHAGHDDGDAGVRGGAVQHLLGARRADLLLRGHLVYHEVRAPAALSAPPRLRICAIRGDEVDGCYALLRRVVSASVVIVFAVVEFTRSFASLLAPPPRTSCHAIGSSLS